MPVSWLARLGFVAAGLFLICLGGPVAGGSSGFLITRRLSRPVQ